MLLCRQAQQKWDLATVCLDHMRLAVKGLMPLSSSVSVHYPGMAVMLQLLGMLLPLHRWREAGCQTPCASASAAGYQLLLLWVLAVDVLEKDVGECLRAMLKLLRTEQQHMHGECCNAVQVSGRP